eukprot:TRINITY_DN5212_c0_g1_i3.p2 TRINITY_DN5212_c0_g1~~TRINITY_DN5212_c0_g1_i3.p2  ORF type:complete len:132 (+),score=29.37 TRINITY_DN5212_c0_g1_i3:105-500(+)
MDNRGRKLVCEKIGQEERYKNYFKNLEESKAESFDSEWQRMARSLGMKQNTVPYTLPYRRDYGGHDREGQFEMDRAIEYDGQRRGAYVPSRVTNERMPVNVRGARLPASNALPLPAEPNPPRQHPRYSIAC